MAPPLTPWGRLLNEKLAADPDRWWNLDQLVDTAAHLIPPGQAWRIGEAEQARYRTTGTGRPRSSDEARIRRGRRTILRKLANGRVRRHAWKTTLIDGARHWSHRTT